MALQGEHGLVDPDARPTKEIIMNHHYNPTSLLVRSAFVAAALTITVTIGAFINTLACHYGPGDTQAAQQALAIVARA